MPWCPKCRCEYRPGFTVCSDCGLPLAEKLETTQEPHKCTLPAGAELALLAVESDRTFLEMICRMLQDSDIPVLTMDYDSAGSFVHNALGINTYGICIFVAQNQLERAKEVMNAYFPDRFCMADTGEAEAPASVEEDTLESESKGACANFSTRKKLVRTGILLVVLVQVVALVAGLFLTLFHSMGSY